jgi:hypothetical protein
MSASQKGHFRLSALSHLTVSLISLPHFKHVISSVNRRKTWSCSQNAQNFLIWQVLPTIWFLDWRIPITFRHAGKLRHLLKLREMLEAGGEHHFVENIDAALATENFSHLSQFRAGVEEKPSDCIGST